MKKYLLLIVIFLGLGLAHSASATVAYDSEAHSSLGTGTISTTTAPVGTPRGVQVYVTGKLATADGVDACTYGGTAMTETTNSPVVKTASEALEVHSFQLNSSIPTGPQTVSCTVNTANSKQLHVYLVTAAADTQAVSTTTISSDSIADPKLTLQLSGLATFVSTAAGSGLNDVVTNSAPFAGWSLGSEVDDVSQGHISYKYDTIDTTDVGSCGYDQNVATDDAVVMCVGLTEVVGGAPAVGEEIWELYEE